LAERLNGRHLNIKTVSLHPGIVDSGFGQNKEVEETCFSKLFTCFKPIMCCCMKNPSEGAETTLYTSQVDFQKLQNGEYYADEKRAEMSKSGRNKAEAEKLWEIS
jgi:hypothetical protein